MLGSWCPRLVRSVDPFYMLFSRHVDKFENFYKLHTLKSDAPRFFKNTVLDLFCFEKPYDTFYLVKNAMVRVRDFYIERRQRTNMRRC